MAREVRDAVVVGAGPNGLAAAITLARAGLDVLVLEEQPTAGGGARTEALNLAPGVRHDLCSAVHPLALASPFLRDLDLAGHGLRLHTPEISYAHPLGGECGDGEIGRGGTGGAALAWRDLDRTVEELGAEGRRWRRLLGPLVAHPAELIALALGDHRSVPAALRRADGVRTAAAFGRGMLQQGWDWEGWPGLSAGRAGRGGAGLWREGIARDGAAQALLGGVASHAIGPLPSPAAAGTALLLAALGHIGGWPVPIGGSQAITAALLTELTRHGGEVRTGAAVRHWRTLPRARAYLLDTAAGAAAQIWDDRLTPRVRRALVGVRHGDGATRVDFVLSGPVPWTIAQVGAAGTVHLGGSWRQQRAAAAEVAAGRHSEHPIVLLSDPAVSDPSRIVGGRRPLWTYAHVPHGSDRDLAETVTAQIEAHAPGFRDLVVAVRCTPAADLVQHNANLVGGDIAGGRLGLGRLLLGVRRSSDAYGLGIPGVYLCSSATPPGPGVHGMCGWYAAQQALRERFGRVGG